MPTDETATIVEHPIQCPGQISPQLHAMLKTEVSADIPFCICLVSSNSDPAQPGFFALVLDRRTEVHGAGLLISNEVDLKVGKEASFGRINGIHG